MTTTEPPAEIVAGARTLRARIMLAIRLVAVPAALAAGWFLARSQGLELKPTGGVHLLLGALLVNQCAILLIGWRMAVGLRLFGVEIPMRDALRIAIQSQFYFFFIPVSASNEVSRYLKIRAIRPQSTMHSLVVSLVLDRLMGLLACVVIALAALPFVGLRPIAGVTLAPAWLLLIVGMLGAGAVLVAWRLGWLRKLADAVRETRGRRGLLVPATALVLVMQLATITSVWLAARWLGLPTPWVALAFGISVGTLGQVVPVTFAGAGPAEVAGAAAFLALGATGTEAGALAALVYMTRLMAALEGGAWELLQGVRSLRVRGAAA